MPWFVMSFIWLIVVFAVLGLLYWLFNFVAAEVPLPAPVAKIVRVFFTVMCVIVLICWLLSLVGAIQMFPGPGYSGHGISWR